jgi:pre-rRNA-processing protein TSR3
MQTSDDTDRETPGECLQDVVIRHPKERKSKCSLEPLRGRSDILFETARPGFRFDATGFILLRVDAPVLSSADGNCPLLLLDSTWRLLPQVEACVTGSPVERSLPSSIVTAYPRVSKISADPARGLASVEALYAARRLQARPVVGLLDQYFWKSTFLAQFK